MYNTPDNYIDMTVGTKVRDIHFGLTWEIIEKRDNGDVIVQNRPPEGTKMTLTAFNSDMIFSDKRIRKASDITEEILEFIEDNRPTEIGTDWERGCAYAMDEIEKIINK